MVECTAMRGLFVGGVAEYRRGPLKLLVKRKVPGQALNLTLVSVMGATARLPMVVRGPSVQGAVPSKLGVEPRSSIMV